MDVEVHLQQAQAGCSELPYATVRGFRFGGLGLGFAIWDLGLRVGTEIENLGSFDFGFCVLSFGVWFGVRGLDLWVWLLGLIKKSP